MSSILTASFGKTYKPIGQIKHKPIGTSYSYDDTFCKGKIHSVYARLDEADYKKLYEYYNKENALEDHKYVTYSNNKILVLCFGNVLANQYYCEKVNVKESVVYNFEDVDVAYVIDTFEKRSIIKPELLNTTSVRYNSTGHWCSLNSKLIMFLGKRILYNSHFDNLTHINANDRLSNGVPDLHKETAHPLSILSTLDTREEYCVFYRVINRADYAFSLLDIKKLFTSQNLSHLIQPNLNLLQDL